MNQDLTFAEMFEDAAAPEQPMDTRATCAALFGILREALAEKRAALSHEELF